MTVQATHPRTDSRTVRAGREWTPLALVRTLLRHRALIRQLIGRDIAQRYRGSYLGLAWSFLVPLLTLGVYTVVFSAVLQARWGPEERTPSVGEFALILFAGLVPFNLLAECLTRAPGLITGTPQYVKKVIFPVEVLLSPRMARSAPSLDNTCHPQARPLSAGTAVRFGRSKAMTLCLKAVRPHTWRESSGRTRAGDRGFSYRSVL